MSHNSSTNTPNPLDGSNISPKISAQSTDQPNPWQSGQDALQNLYADSDQPDHIAIEFKELLLSYHDLYTHVDRLSFYLTNTLNIKPEDIVAVSLHRSPELIISFLAILKAGAVYFPIDPSYPEARIAQMLAEAKPSVIITSNPRLAAPDFPSERILLPSDLSQIRSAQHPGTSPAQLINPSNAAYLIYTSGSTGQPKGALLSRRGLSNLIESQRHIFKLKSNDRVLQFASIAFDASIWEFIMALGARATLVMAPESELLTGIHLAKLLQRTQISALTLTPTVLGTIPIGMEGLLDKLDTLVVAGEACPLPLARRWATGRTMFNAYGPTETTVCATVHRFDPETLSDISIGTPLPNVTCHVLDEEGKEVQPGGTGELFIGGLGVARGYLNRPDLSAERFTPNIFSTLPGARVYRTGDLVRQREDGSFEFLRRTDEQIKLHGIRIELGEIESLLREHPAIQNAAAALKTNKSGQSILAAYYIAQRFDHPPTADELRAHLQPRLPSSMMPSAFIPIAELPTSTTGKLDRTVLPNPWDMSTPAQRDALPGSELENLISTVFSDALQSNTIQPSDNFFNIGGNSIIAAEVVGHLERDLNLSLPIATLFEAPTVSSLAAAVAQKASAGTNPNRPLAVTKADNPSQVPLSPIQRQIWLLSNTAPLSPVYNETLIFNIHDSLDIQTFRRAFYQIVQRHDALRTTFIMRDGNLSAITHTHLQIPVEYSDLRHLPAAAREAEAKRLMLELAKKPFDLARGPLANSLLIQLDTRAFQFCLLLHHIISDRISIYYILIPELIEAYAQISAGKPLSLPKPELQYADFAIWQHNLIQGGNLSKELSFWKELLDRDITPLRLPTNESLTSSSIPFAGRRVQFALPRSAIQALKSYGQQEHLTPFIIFLTAYIALLYRYADQSDIIIGTIDASRKDTALKSIVGNFLQTIVVRTHIQRSSCFGALLRQIRSEWLDALSNSNLPFDRIVQELHPTRQAGQNPLFQVAFAFHPPVPTYSHNWELSRDELDTETSKFDLTLFVRELQDDILCAFEYNTNLFDTSAIERMAGHYCRLISQAASNPNIPLGSIDLLTSQEKQTLKEWSHIGIPPIPYMCISEMLSQKAAQTPNAPAIIYEDQTFSYAELDRRANQLAHHLQAIGIRTETMAAVVLEHCPDLLIALYAILKAGGTYVPIEPSYPAARIELMLEDSNASVLVTHSKHLPLVHKNIASPICLDTDLDTVSRQPADPPRHQAGPDHAAYVIYTSGSTGRPKGAIITRRNVWELAVGLQEVFLLQPADRILQFGSISFDISIGEFVMALAPGAALVIAPEPLRLPGTGLVQYMLDKEITAFSLTPTVLNDFPPESENALQSIQTLVVAGEACPLSLIQRWAKGRRMFNMYGPTETTVCSTLGDLSAPNLRRVPIGKPIAKLACYVLDSYGLPVPEKVAGELYIGGTGVGRGYINRPALSAERFIPDPFSRVASARMYKTGDLVRWQSDGNLEFIGRIDNQVKIRGARVELGELEGLLQSHSAVKDAVAAVKTSPTNDQHLIAYIIPKDNPAPTLEAELREYVRVHAPSFLNPAFILLLERFPLLSSGKTDRKQLPDPPQWHVAPQSKGLPPANTTERLVAGIWQQILGQTNIGLDDNFFDIGGNSLLIARVQNALQQSMNRSISIIELFRHPTVRALAEHLMDESPPSASGGLIQQSQDRAARQRQAMERQKQAAALKRRGS